MSKVALQKILDQITEKGSGPVYRKKVSDAQSHSLVIDKTQIRNALAVSFSYDEAYKNLITPTLLDRAASYYYVVITRKMAGIAQVVGNQYIIKAGAASSPGKTINNPYDAIAKRINDTNRDVLIFLQKIVNTEPSKVKAGDLVNFDHVRTLSDTRIGAYFAASKAPDLLTLLRDKEFITEEDYEVLTEVKSYYTSNGTKGFYVEANIVGDIRSGIENVSEGRDVVAARSVRVKSLIQKALLSKTAIDWANQPGSDSKIQQIRKTLVSSAMKSIKKTNIVKFIPETRDLIINTSSNSAKKKTIVKETSAVTSTKIKAKGLRSGGMKTTPQARSSYVSLMNIFNSKLPEIVRGNMIGGRLHNRSGRFSESVRVTNITETSQGYPSIEYTYARSPYDVFDPVIGASPWNTPDRDPKKLVDLSIRDIAINLAIGRFYTRRQ